MKKFILWAMFVMAVGLSSCSDVEMPDTDATVGVVQSRSGQVSEYPVLSFDSQADFDKAVNTIASLPSEQAKSEWMKENYPDFYSIQNLYENAMEEMAEIDESSNTQYENFQEKYKNLYFPRYIDDAGYYIPMSNLDASYLVNKACEVSIAGETVNLRDVNDYGKLMELGRAYYASEQPMPVAAMGVFYLNSTEMNSVGPEYDSGWTQYDKRKVKLKARRVFKTYQPNVNVVGSKSYLHLEFCFRKKTVLGWANYKSESTIVFKVTIPGKGVIGPLTFNHNSNSSHDDEFEYPIQITSDSASYYFTFVEAPCEATITYRGVSMPLRYNWNMPGIQCVTPKAASYPLILPNY